MQYRKVIDYKGFQIFIEIRFIGIDELKLISYDTRGFRSANMNFKFSFGDLYTLIKSHIDKILKEYDKYALKEDLIHPQLAKLGFELI